MFFDSFNVVKMVVGKVGFVFDKGLELGFELVNNFSRLFFPCLTVDRKVIDICVVLAFRTSFFVC
jgi:hypothetical protein